MKKLKIGVIGCGTIAKYRHLPEYDVNPNVELTAVCDLVPERAEAYADQNMVQRHLQITMSY